MRNTGRYWLTWEFWLVLAIGFPWIIGTVLIGGLSAGALEIWLFEGGNVFEELLRPGPMRDKPVKVLFFAIGAGVGGRLGVWALTGMIRKTRVGE